MKFNWGHGIAIFMILFMIAIISAVYYVTSQNVELVEEDYYHKEVTYQQTIDAKKNSIYLKDSIEIMIDTQNVTIVFAPSLMMKSANGNVHFYRPNNSKLDQNYQLKDHLNGNKFSILRSDIVAGKYSCSINWMQNSRSFIWQKDIYL